MNIAKYHGIEIHVDDKTKLITESTTLKEIYNMENIFTDEFLEEIGFKRTPTKGKPKYGRAIDKRTNGMTVLQWNNDGHHCTYFGEALQPNVSFGIKKDGGTRTAFNGYVFNQDDVRNLLKMTW